MEFSERESSGETIIEIKRGDFPPSASETWLPAPIVPPIKHCWASSPQLPVLRTIGSLAKEKYIKNPQIINTLIALFHNFSVSPHTSLIYISYIYYYILIFDLFKPLKFLPENFLMEMRRGVGERRRETCKNEKILEEFRVETEVRQQIMIWGRNLNEAMLFYCIS